MRTKLAAAALLPVVASLLLVPPTASAEVAHPPIWDKGPGGERYVAMGDSFTSGPGINPMRPGECMRSEKNFPTLIATAYDVNSFTDASCGGATTAHLTTVQGTNQPQLDALQPDTTLVTFGTIGGNDIGLVQLAASCFGDANCVPAAGTDPLAAKFAQVEADLTAGIVETKRRSPAAKIVVVGYGTYIRPGGCAALSGLGIEGAEADYVQSQIDRLSDTLEQVADAQGVHFADLREIPGSLDHTACAAPEDQWIRALATYDDGAPLHPSTAGMAAMAAYLEQVIGTLGQPAPDPVAERRAELRKKAAGAKFTARCVGPKRNKKVRFRAFKGQGAIARTAFRVGKKRIAVDRSAPYVVKRKAAKVKRHRGKVKAVITFRDAELVVKRTVVKKRPRCMRR